MDDSTRAINVFVTGELITKSLYKEIEVSGTLKNILINDNDKLDLYCPTCRTRRIFTFKNNCYYSEDLEWGEYVKREKGFITFEAAADCGHSLIMIFRAIDERYVEKIGQYPPIYDLHEQISNKKSFSKLEDEYRDYYAKSCSLNSVNSNIGALTYLRRIFEKLLIDCFNDNCEKKDFEAFKIMSIEDKAGFLKNYLPNLLFEPGFNMIYSLIGDGVHHLSEEQCGENFSTIKIAIEEILIDKIQAEEKKMRLNSLKKQMQESASKKN
jgi:hypothetical protein